MYDDRDNADDYDDDHLHDCDVIIVMKMVQVQNQTHSSEGALSSLEEALNDRYSQTGRWVDW